MALLNDPKQPIRFTPVNKLKATASEQTVYLLKVPTVWDRVSLEKAIAARGGRMVGDADLIGALRDGVVAIFGASPAKNRDQLLAQIEGADAARADLGRKMMDGSYNFATEDGRAAFDRDRAIYQAQRAALAEVEELVAEGYPRYRKLLSAQAAYPMIHALEAARIFLVGWEKGPADFVRDVTGVPDDLLMKIPEFDLREIGGEVGRLLRPTVDERKNSESPSPGAADPATSTAASSTTTTVH